MPVMVCEVVGLLRDAWTHSPEGRRQRMRRWVPIPSDAEFFANVPDPDRAVTVCDETVPVFAIVRLTCKRTACGYTLEMTIEDFDAALELVSAHRSGSLQS